VFVVQRMYFVYACSTKRLHILSAVTWLESLQGRRTMFAACTLEKVSQSRNNVKKMCLSMFLKVDNVDAERMSSGRLFQATGPATENARLPSGSLVPGTTKSTRAA